MDILVAGGRIRRLKWVVVSLAVVVALVSVVALVGMLLPTAHVARRSLVLAQPPDSVWAVISDVSAYPSWWGDIDRVEPLANRDGRPAWRLHMASGPLPLEVTELSPPTYMLTTILSEGLPFGGTWTYEIVSQGPGSRVTVTERGEIYNPLFRFMARFVFGYEGTIESYLRALAEHYGADPVVTGE